MSDEEKKFNEVLENFLRDMADDEEEENAWERFSDPDEGEGIEKLGVFDGLDEQDVSENSESYNEKPVVPEMISVEETDPKNSPEEEMAEAAAVALTGALLKETPDAESKAAPEPQEKSTEVKETAEPAENEAQQTEATEKSDGADQTRKSVDEAETAKDSEATGQEAGTSGEAAEETGQNSPVAAETVATAETVAAVSKQRTKSARPSSGRYEDSFNKNISNGNDNVNPTETPKKKHKFLKCLGLTAAMLAVAAGTGYAGVSYYFSNRFFDGTTINGVDVSRMTALEVEKILEEKVSDYSIEVLARDQQPQIIDGSAINYRYMSDGEVLEYLKNQKPYEWVMGYIEPKTYAVKESTVYDKEMLKSEIRQLECAKPENQVEPENAYVAYTDSKFEIIPETQGTALNIKEAYRVLEAAVSGNQQSVNFNEVPDVYEEATITKEDADLQATMDACNNFTRASITYDFGNDSVVLDGSVIKDWLVFDEKGQLVENDSSFTTRIREFVDGLKSKYDTVGTSREFYTTSGRVVNVYGSAYGWQIDKEAEVAQLTQEIQSGAQTVREPVYSRTANARGVNDFGNTYIEVDLAYQHMYYYQYGSIIFDTDIVSGNPNLDGRATPPGVFTLYYKKSPDVLRGAQDENGNYEYETPVQYWMPFNGGVGFHDATWQPYFGGDLYLWNGSHGCINLPLWAAATLYDIIQYNVPIIVFY